jgi:membrane associated rhomboid family serine protease
MPQLPPALKNLLIIMALVGLAQVALPNIGFNPNQLYLFYPDSYQFQWWQIFTHVFCHGNIGHFIFNGIALFSFGLVVELRLGSQRFLQFNSEHFFQIMPMDMKRFPTVQWSVPLVRFTV